MPVLTVRISEKEKASLTRRAKAAGISEGSFVRRLLNESPLVTGDDLARDIERHLGDTRLRVRRKSRASV